jgi:hypothetical protein
MERYCDGRDAFSPYEVLADTAMATVDAGGLLGRQRKSLLEPLSSGRRPSSDGPSGRFKIEDKVLNVESPMKTGWHWRE